ncbi:helix-turn-helix domain-containing protein [Kitasatospora sp. SUK 42]|uniref:helix-turn-helix domain-containing protein n=1 Tax=Kitasatospora sp. SUK 42 TaxID=1588882 RepID=UPI0018C91B9B|nr:helix-turn-helix transcriptional regulator [Kitasatospora sp. SUK 42]MBV2151905.1 helix-turn-helix domain-containing protein [Kitasatospora sp. SUK 42]
MAPTLHDLLGIDPNDPRTAAGLEDAEAYAALVETLVVARIKCGLTQRDVAQLMGTTQSTISAFERAGGDARYSTLQRYARAVGARLHSLVDHTGSAVTPAWQPAPVEVEVQVALRERGPGSRPAAWDADTPRTVST